MNTTATSLEAQLKQLDSELDELAIQISDAQVEQRMDKVEAVYAHYLSKLATYRNLRREIARQQRE